MYVPCPYNAQTICETLVGCLMDWNADCNLSTFTVDNCTTNDVVISLMREVV